MVWPFYKIGKMGGKLWKWYSLGSMAQVAFGLHTWYCGSCTVLLLWSESTSGKCAELHTVAASNNRVHPTKSLSSSPLACTINCSHVRKYYKRSFTKITLRVRELLRSIVHMLVSVDLPRHDLSFIACSSHIYVWCCSSRTSGSWWITQSTQHRRRGCNSGHLYLVCLWRHNLTAYSCFQNKVLAKFVDTICIIFYTHCPYCMRHCTEYKLSAFQVRIAEESILNATTQQFITAKISGAAR